MLGAQALTRVRRFNGHSDRITDLQISTDARWLLSASMDGTLRVWDIPASAILQVRRPPGLQLSRCFGVRMRLMRVVHVIGEDPEPVAERMLVGE